MVHSANNEPTINLTNFKQLPNAAKYYIAYSGGMDSTALLYAASLDNQFKNKLTAIHVNHHINESSDQWQSHCEKHCKLLNIPLITASVALDDHSEASCRQARLDVFKQHLSINDCLLTAHHMNDQVETILFRLLRGTGLVGITGMSCTNGFDHYTIHRPLLKTSQLQIKKFVQDNQLSYVNDPSNQYNHYSRNHIRNLIIPELENYHSQAVSHIEVTAKNLQQSHQLLNHFIGHENPFKFERFCDHELLTSALYHWLHNLNVQSPNRKRLIQFSLDCIQAAGDKNPELYLGECKLVRWKKKIFALKTCQSPSKSELNITLSSDQHQITLDNNGCLEFHSTQTISWPAVIKFQQGNDKIRTHKNNHHKKVKSLFQQQGIPPWERTRIPYLYINNQLMAVGSNIKSVDFKNMLSKYNAEYRWLSPHYVL